MAEPKEMVATAIARAQGQLEEALAELEKIPAFDPDSVAYIAHALSNYLAVAGGTIDLMIMHLGDSADAQLKVWLKGLRHDTDLMTSTLGQLLNASPAPAAQLQLDKVDLPTLVQRACAHYQRIADRKAIRIRFGPAAGVPPVSTDRVLVAAVLDNLVSNAIKYSPPGKEIHVQVRGEPGWGICEVRDEGPGLSAADQARLFQRGVRLTPTPTGGEPSTGYGLAVAKELIDKLGGTIRCESVLGHGCCFSFRLPAYQAPNAAPSSGPIKPG
jgi:signal transduction histidine kinase